MQVGNPPHAGHKKNITKSTNIKFLCNAYVGSTSSLSIIHVRRLKGNHIKRSKIRHTGKCPVLEFAGTRGYFWVEPEKYDDWYINYSSFNYLSVIGSVINLHPWESLSSKWQQMGAGLQNYLYPTLFNPKCPFVGFWSSMLRTRERWGGSWLW